MECNHQDTCTHRILTRVIILALLLHILLLLFFLAWKHHDKAYELKLQALKEQMLQKMLEQKKLHPDQPDWQWVAGHAPANNAPVVFEDEPEEVEQKQEQEKPVEQDQKHQEKAKVIEKPADKHEEKKAESTKKIESTELLEDIPAPKQGQETKYQETQQPHEQAQQQPAQSPKKITLAQITNGLIEKLQENSSHVVSALGPNQGVPCDEQIRYERYIAKIFACMQKSIRIHNRNLRLPEHKKFHVYFNLSLHRDGKLNSVHITQSSGLRELDNFILFIINDAAPSFPPVPTHIKFTTYPLGFIANPSNQDSWFNVSYN